MAERGDVKIVPCIMHGKAIAYIERLVMLEKEKPPSYQKWKHEITRGDCYVALHKTGSLTGYRSKWSADEYPVFAKQHGVYFDSHFDLQGVEQTFFLEVDMGTEYWENELDEKVLEYAGLMQSMPNKPVYCLFVTDVKETGSIANRLKGFCRCFHDHGRQQNFLATSLELFLDDPLGAIWAGDGLTKPASLTAL